MTDSINNKLKPLVSIIIPTYTTKTKDKNLLKKCLDSILKTIYPNIEIIVIDNNSPIDNLSWIKENSLLRILHNDSDIGYGGSINRAVSVSNGHFIAVISDDMTVEPHWINLLLKEFFNSSNCGILTCTELTYDAKIESATGGLMDLLGNAYLRGSKDKRSFFIDQNTFFYAHGSPTFMEKKTFDEVDGFDSDYYLYVEDIDLSWRIRLKGYNISYTKSTMICHKTSQTSGPFSPQKMYYYERNTLLSLLKNYSNYSLALVMPLYIIQAIMTIIFFALTANLNLSASVIKAIAWNIINLQKTLEKRNHIQKARLISDIQILGLIHMCNFRFLRVPYLDLIIYRLICLESKWRHL